MTGLAQTQRFVPEQSGAVELLKEAFWATPLGVLIAAFRDAR